VPIFGIEKGPGGEQFQQHRFKFVFDFIDFIDQKDAGPFLLEGFKQRTRHEICAAGYLAFDLGPVRSPVALAHQQDIEFLQAAIVLANRLFFVDSLIALETQQRNAICSGYGACKFGFSRARGAFSMMGRWILPAR